MLLTLSLLLGIILAQPKGAVLAHVALAEHELQLQLRFGKNAG